MVREEVQQYLPLTEATYYILLALVSPLHGYGVMQWIHETSRGLVTVGAGTLYNAFSLLLKEGLIVKVDEDERRKYYRLTTKGKQVLLRQIERLEVMTAAGQDAKASLAEAGKGDTDA